jgi:hypothetical protein
VFANRYRRRVGSDYAGHLTVVVRGAGQFDDQYTKLVGDDGFTVVAFDVDELRELHESIGEALWLQQGAPQAAAAPARAPAGR